MHVLFAEQIIHVQQAGAQGERQQHHADLGDMEHLALNAHQRRHVGAEGQLLVFQQVVEPGELQGIERGDDQGGVREQRQADMHHQFRAGLQVSDELAGHKAGEGQVDHGEAVDDWQQEPAAIARSDEGHHRADDQADDGTNVQQAEILPGADVKDALLQRDGVANQRHHRRDEGKPTVCAVLPQQTGNDQSKAEQVGHQSHNGENWHSV
ncbi:Uncharacterised protein [Acinetobacter baumannii]|nr:Uncharacterised protein [Acinetobacter baumannii]